MILILVNSFLTPKYFFSIIINYLIYYLYISCTYILNFIIIIYNNNNILCHFVPFCVLTKTEGPLFMLNKPKLKVLKGGG